MLFAGDAGTATLQVKAGNAMPDDAGCGSSANYGMSVDGFGVAVERNTVADFGAEPFAAGFTVDGTGHSLLGNGVGDGIEVGADTAGTTVSFSRASGNLLDFCDLGTATTLVSNEFGTSGAPCATD